MSAPRPFLAALAALSLLATAAAQGPERALVLAVQPFKSLSSPERAYLGPSFSEAISAKLCGISSVKVYERAQFERLASELKLERDAQGLFDPSSLARAGMVVSIDYVLLGSVTEAAGKIECVARLVHVNSGKVALAHTSRGSVESLFDMEDEMALAVADALALKLSELELKRLAKRSTSDAGAFELYNKSLASADRTSRVSLLLGALQRDPSFTAAMHPLADAYYESGYPEKSAEIYARILEADPGDYRAAYNLGLLKLDLGDSDGAIALMERCVAMKPGDADAWYHAGLAREYGEGGNRFGPGADLEGAMELYAVALAMDPLHREARLGIGMLAALLAQAEPDAARRLERLRLSVRYLGDWLALCPADEQSAEIAANIELLKASVSEHEAWLSRQPGR
jgi:tetratricopeptide (TPR) repeat protein